MGGAVEASLEEQLESVSLHPSQNKGGETTLHATTTGVAPAGIPEASSYDTKVALASAETKAADAPTCAAADAPVCADAEAPACATCTGDAPASRQLSEPSSAPKNELASQASPEPGAEESSSHAAASSPSSSDAPSDAAAAAAAAEGAELPSSSGNLNHEPGSAGSAGSAGAEGAARAAAAAAERSSEPAAGVPSSAMLALPAKSVDNAIIQALLEKERPTVIKLEEMIHAFLADSSRDVLEFPRNLSNYQRMLAHRVGQHYGLQTSTVDYETSFGRVVGSRTMYASMNKPKLADIPLSALSAQQGPLADRSSAASHVQACDAEGDSNQCANLSCMRRPHGSGKPASGVTDGRKARSSIREREEEHKQAHEGSVFNGGITAPDWGLGPPEGGGMGRPPVNRGMEGHKGSGPSGRIGTGGGRGRGRQALTRERENEEVDTDYRRGANKYGQPAPSFDPYRGIVSPGGGFTVPYHGIEFRASSSYSQPPVYSVVPQQGMPYSIDPNQFSAPGPIATYPKRGQWPVPPATRFPRPPPPPPPPLSSGPPIALASWIPAGSQPINVAVQPSGMPLRPLVAVNTGQHSHVGAVLTSQSHQVGAVPSPGGYPVAGYPNMLPGAPMMAMYPQGPAFQPYVGMPMPAGGMPTYGYPPPGGLPSKEPAGAAVPMGMPPHSHYQMYAYPPAQGLPLPAMWQASVPGSGVSLNGQKGFGGMVALPIAYIPAEGGMQEVGEGQHAAAAGRGPQQVAGSPGGGG